MKHHVRRTTLLSLVSFPFALAGCLEAGGGGDAASSHVSSASVLVAGHSDALSPRAVGVLVPEDLTRVANRSPVDPADIDSLWVTITEITLERSDRRGGTVGDGDVVVQVSNHAFTPEKVEISVGDTVTWVWAGDGRHTITSGVRGERDSGLMFDAGGEFAGDVFMHTFQTSGNVPYFSDEDLDAANEMTGVVRVSGREADASKKETVFNGAARMNLKDLDAVSEVLSIAAIPPGRYTGVHISLKDPELFLVTDPDGPITDIQLAANGRYVIGEDFEVAPHESIFTIIDFGDIHLVETGSGNYWLTPQLRLLVDIIAADVEIRGIITAIHSDMEKAVVLTNLGDEVLVDLTALSATLGAVPEGFASSNGGRVELGDLETGQAVYVIGTLHADNTVEASSVVIEVE